MVMYYRFRFSPRDLLVLGLAGKPSEAETRSRGSRGSHLASGLALLALYLGYISDFSFWACRDPSPGIMDIGALILLSQQRCGPPAFPRLGSRGLGETRGWVGGLGGVSNSRFGCVWCVCLSGSSRAVVTCTGSHPARGHGEKNTSSTRWKMRAVRCTPSTYRVPVPPSHFVPGGLAELGHIFIGIR